MQKLLGNLDTGLLFIISAPSGTGKSTLVNRLTREFPHIVRSISYTTRAKRKNEIEGKDYFFVSSQEFEKKVQNNDFLEYAKVFDDAYGTDKNWVEKKLNKNKHVFLVIDTQGALSLMKKSSATTIFLNPPNSQELKKRLEKRQCENNSLIEKRLSWAQEEMSQAKYYDYIVLNEDEDVAYQILRSIVIAEEYRNRQKIK